MRSSVRTGSCSGKRFKKERGVGIVSETMEKEDVVLMSSMENEKGVWKRNFERLMNENTAGGSISNEHGYGGRWKEGVWAESERAEIEKAIPKFKCGKTAGIHGITPEIVKCGGNVVWSSMETEKY